jgi:phosphoglycolate phosphatase
MHHIVFDHDGTLVDTSETPRLFLEVEGMLKTLKEAGATLYLWTARDRQSTLEILQSLGIKEFFKEISTASDCDSKPSTAGLEIMLGESDKDDVFVVGDSMTDINGGSVYGAQTIAVTWGTDHPDIYAYFKQSPADHVCETVQECQSVLLNWINE